MPGQNVLTEYYPFVRARKRPGHKRDGDDYRPPAYVIVGLVLLAGSFGIFLIPSGQMSGKTVAVLPNDQQVMAIIQTRCDT